MKFTQQQTELLIKEFDSTFNNTELEEAFKNDFNDMYNAILTDVLVQNGYPENVKPEKSPAKIKINPKTTVEDFVKYVEEAEIIEDIEDFMIKSTDTRFYIDTILINIGETNIEVEFTADPKEYLEMYPTVDYLAREMEKYFNSTDFEEVIRNDEEFIEDIQEEAEDEGFHNIPIEKIKYKITDLKPADSYEYFADLMINNDVFSDETTVQSFLKKDYYNELARGKQYEVDIEFLIDPEEIDEM